MRDGDGGGSGGAAKKFRGRIQKRLIQEIGDALLQSLVDAGEFEEAARACPGILGTDAALWICWFDAFAKASEIPTIAPFLPTSRPQLPSNVYEAVITHFAQRDPGQVLAYVRAWGSAHAAASRATASAAGRGGAKAGASVGLFSVDGIIVEVESILRNSSERQQQQSKGGELSASGGGDERVLRLLLSAAVAELLALKGCYKESITRYLRSLEFDALETELLVCYDADHERGARTKGRAGQGGAGSGAAKELTEEQQSHLTMRSARAGAFDVFRVVSGA